MYKLRRRILNFLKAMAMGAADVIPGVSGGTIAFITGIYERFIEALSNIDLTSLKLLFQGKIMALEQRIHGFFLLTILAGILTSVILLANLILYLLETYPIHLWAFFFGLIAASILVVSNQIKKWNYKLVGFLILGGVIAYYLTHSTIIQTPNTPLYIFLAGIISISAMILPGVSGSYLLVVLDKYEYIISIMSSLAMVVKDSISALFIGDFPAIRSLIVENNVHMLLFFYAGTFSGLVGFSKILNWLFKRFYYITISLLTGFMLGSLIKIWPWKRTVETYIDRHGDEQPLLQHNILPDFNLETLLAFIFVALGFYIVYGIEYLSEKYKPKAENES